MFAVICWMLLATAGFAQVSDQPMGIPALGIPSVIVTNDLSITPLTVESLVTITDDTYCACLSGCSVVPVTLLSFEGVRKNTLQVNLFWKTENEFQNKGFEVQRSLGSTTAFAPVTFVPAKATNASKKEYSLPDANDYAGISYYRLKQLDLDGRFEFSETIAVNGYSNAASLSVFPNPADDKLVATIYALKQTTAVLLLTDATQKRHYTQSIQLTRGMNTVTLPVAHLPAAIYLVKVVTQEGEVLSARFIKL